MWYYIEKYKIILRFYRLIILIIFSKIWAPFDAVSLVRTGQHAADQERAPLTHNGVKSLQ